MVCSRQICTHAAILVACVLAASSAGAVTFHATLSPIRINARPGQVITRQFELTLPSDQKRTVFKARAEDWWRSEDGKQSFYAMAGSLRNSCSPWVSLNPMEAGVEPGGALRVRITVSVPVEVRSGGFWCALTLDETPDPLDVATDAVDVRFLASVSVAIFVYIDPVQRSGEIVDLQVSGDEARVTLRNTGNAPLAVEGQFEFRRAEHAEPVASVTIPRWTVLTEPITTGVVAAALPDAAHLPSGRYLVRAVLDIGLDHYLGVEQEIDVTRGVASGAQP
jgi:hypothetical protein